MEASGALGIDIFQCRRKTELKKGRRCSFISGQGDFSPLVAPVACISSLAPWYNYVSAAQCIPGGCLLWVSSVITNPPFGAQLLHRERDDWDMSLVCPQRLYTGVPHAHFICITVS